MESGTQKIVNSEKIVETQSEIRVECCRKCPVKDIKGYCEDCKEPFCKECFEKHIGHKMVNLKDFCEEKEKAVLDQISVRGISVQLEYKRKEIMSKGNKLQEELENAERAVKVKEDFVKNKEENYKLELGRMEAVIRYLVGLEEETSTVVLKNA